MKILKEKLELVKTCSACPEQYDVFYNYKCVAYLRLRHGNFSISVPDCGANRVKMFHPKGDGEFTNKERPYFLNRAKKIITKEIKSLIKSSFKFRLYMNIPGIKLLGHNLSFNDGDIEFVGYFTSIYDNMNIENIFSDYKNLLIENL